MGKPGSVAATVRKTGSTRFRAEQALMVGKNLETHREPHLACNASHAPNY